MRAAYMKHRRPKRISSGTLRRNRTDGWRLAAGLAAIGVVTVAYSGWFGISNAAVVSTTFLMIVLLVAATSRLWVAVTTSIVAMLWFNFFFLPPVGTFTIADPQNWVALFAFLGVSLVASRLSAVARARTEEARDRRDELARLFDLGRDVLVMTESRPGIAALARSVARRFDMTFVAIAMPRGDDWEIVQAGSETIPLDRREIANAYAVAQTSMEFDAQARTYAGHRTMVAEGRSVRIVPLRAGTKPIGLLAAAGRPIEPGTLDALGGVVAIAIERAALLEERKTAELTRQSEELKATLLASLGHDLRTPLTAIRVAATNLQAAGLGGAERQDQSDLILAEVERLTRLFDNVLEMARIDAGAVTTDARWTHPSEIVAAARDQVEQALRAHRVDVTIEPDRPVRLDPRLTASALARLLENAAQYSPEGAAIAVNARVTDDSLTLAVRDRGPGIAAADLPRLFERFYRGGAATSRAAGTGMGLWIARGLLAAEGGRVWAENTPAGGAQFTVVVPVSAREPVAAP
jgi:two-component system sensor histidine kinase KdpD